MIPPELAHLEWEAKIYSPGLDKQIPYQHAELEEIQFSGFGKNFAYRTVINVYPVNTRIAILTGIDGAVFREEIWKGRHNEFRQQFGRIQHRCNLFRHDAQFMDGLNYWLNNWQPGAQPIGRYSDAAWECENDWNDEGAYWDWFYGQD